MSVHPRAGTPADWRDTVDVPRVVLCYYAGHPDPAVPGQRVAFGTSGHRGSSLLTAFNEDHIVATTQAICEYRREQGSTALSSSAATRTPCPSRRWSARWRCWPRTMSRC